MGDENNRVFLDTNILIYAYSDTELEKKERVLSILKNEDISMSTQVINEFIWVMNRKFNVNMNSLKFIINNIFEIYNVTLVTKQSIEKAIGISEKFKYSYWDSLMLSTAIGSKCSIFYTEDLQHEQIIENHLKIVNLFL